MNVAIQCYCRNDLPGLTQAIDAVCAEGMMETSRFQPTIAWQHALDVPDCPHHLLLVAKTKGHLIGWSRLFPDDCDKDEQVELGIGVIRDWRRRGIGGKLLHRALHWATRRDYTRVVLTTRIDNEPALQLFIRNGFQIVDEKGGLLEMAFLPEYIPKRGVKP